MRERKQPYRVVFLPDPVCWTEAPESARVLGSQRNRWQRGLIQVLGYHRRMIGNPRYGVVGMLALPYYVLFEALGPLIEVSGYVVTIGALYYGLINWRFAELMFLPRGLRHADLAGRGRARGDLLPPLHTRQRSAVADGLGVIENFGYRQLTTWWRLKGTFDFLRARAAGAR